MNESPTKERILEAAEAIILEQSFHSVGLNQILSAVSVPKGSFYYYFKSKEQFGVEMLQHYANEAYSRRREFLHNTEINKNPVERLLAFFLSVIERVHESGGKCPCLLQKLAAEVSNFSDPMREELAKGISKTIDLFKETLDEAVTEGSLPPNFDTTSESEFIMDYWAGAQQRAITVRNVAPLTTAVETFRKRLSASS
ncbi:MAG: TetR/AcrR family transcriptional regulator [Verrucomicrobiales bacterium]|nr:TetR/AcrR family transcriptional regulator [Verrucomicrobiales bacterium]